MEDLGMMAVIDGKELCIACVEKVINKSKFKELLYTIIKFSKCLGDKKCDGCRNNMFTNETELAASRLIKLTDQNNNKQGKKNGK